MSALVAALALLAPEPALEAPAEIVRLGPITLSRTAFELISRAVATVIVIAVALALVRLVPVLERLVIRRATQIQGVAEDLAPSSSAENRQRVATLTKVTSSIARALIWTTTLIVVLGNFGISIGPLLAGAGIAGVAVGFGAQSIIKDFFSGFFILLEDQFGVGDTITVGAVTGTVERLTLRITVLRDANGTAHFIPNSNITNVANRTFGWSKVNLDLLFSATLREERVKLVLAEAAKRVSEDPELARARMEPVIIEGPLDLAAGAVTFRLSGKAHVDHTVTLKRSLILALRSALEEHGLGYEGTVIAEKSKGEASARSS
jgi:small-conductance mechanosensitive channel